MNKLKDIKNHFFSELSGQYPEEELNVFYYLLIEEYTGLSKLEILLKAELTTDNLTEEKIYSAIKRLKLYEPVQYIIGKTYFYNIELKVTPDVLIPRPETEQLVDIIIKEFKGEQRTKDNKQQILDIGTGSGCIAIALKKNIPESEVYAMDISEKAIEIAKQNAELNNVRINFFQSDITNPILYPIPKFDIIVSNPPYVMESEKKLMKPNVLDYEPDIALFVKNVNPLAFYKSIINFASDNLFPRAKIYLEINENLGKEIISLLKTFSYNNIELKSDIFDKPRFIIVHT